MCSLENTSLGYRYFMFYLPPRDSCKIARIKKKPFFISKVFLIGLQRSCSIQKCHLCPQRSPYRTRTVLSHSRQTGITVGMMLQPLIVGHRTSSYINNCSENKGQYEINFHGLLLQKIKKDEANCISQASSEK